MAPSDLPEPAPPAPVDPTPIDPPPAPAVLAAGHLHPAVLLLRLIDALRQIVVPLALGVLVERWFLALALFLFLLQLGYALARYLTFQYVLTADELVTREGILSRQERRIPTNRIQDLGAESTLLRRFLGLVVVVVETASGRGAEARLEALGRAEAEHLREVLLAARQGPPVAAPGEAVMAPAPEWLLHRSDAGLLLVRGFTDLRLSAILLALFAAWEVADQLGLSGRVENWVGGAVAWLRGFPLPVVVGIAVALLLFVLGSSLMTSAIANVVMFHGFALTLRGEVLLRRYGLLTTRQKALPLQRVQRALVEQNWLRRMFGFAVVRADSAGGSMDNAAESKAGWDVVVPLARLELVWPLMSSLLPGLQQEQLPRHRVSNRVVLRVGIKGSLLVAVALAVLVPLHGALGLLALSGLPLSFLIGWLYWQNLAYGHSERHLLLRWGVLGRYHSLVPLPKVQSVILRASPLERLLGLCAITVYVAGGSPTRLGDLPRADAEALARKLAAAAAAAAQLDWTKRRSALLADLPGQVLDHVELGDQADHGA